MRAERIAFRGAALALALALGALPVRAQSGAASPVPGPATGAAPGGNGATPGGNGAAPGGNGAAPGGNGAAPGGNGAAPGGHGAAPGGNAPPAGDGDHRARDAQNRRAAKDLSPEERAARVQRWQAMPPEEHARLRQLYEGHLRGRSPDEVEHLRATLGETLPREREATAQRKDEFERRSRDDKLAYQRFMRRLLHALPDQQRRRLAEMDQDERKRAITEMVEQHRSKLVDERVRRLPGRVQGPLAEELAALPPRQRLERVRQAVEQHVLERARQIQNDPTLSAEDRGKRLTELLDRFAPDDQRARERLRRRIAGREDDAPASGAGDRPPAGRLPGNRPGAGGEGERPGAPGNGRRPIGPRRPRR